MTRPLRDRIRAALRSLAILPLFAASACGPREAPPAAGPAPLAFTRVAGHPAGGPLPVLDVATCRQPAGLDQDRYYAAVGSEGLMVHLADGAFLQRLARSAASHLGVLYAMPVDEVVADFLVAADPTSYRLTWFEINAGSGALRRLAGQPAEVGEAVGGLCTHYDAGSRRHRVVVVTRSGELQDWTAVAQAGKQPNFANRIVATRERSLSLGGAGGDCAIDPDGNVYVVVDGRDVRRVGADGSAAPTAVIRSGEPRSPEGTVTAIELVADGGEGPVLLVVDRDGRRMVALEASGRVLSSTVLEHAVSALASGGDAVATVAEGGELRLGAWSQVSAALGVRGGRHQPPAVCWKILQAHAVHV